MKEEEVQIEALMESGEEVGSERNQALLVGKILTLGSFNNKAFMATIAQIWKVGGGVEIKGAGRNIYTLRFLNEKDRSQFEEVGSWCSIEDWWFSIR